MEQKQWEDNEKTPRVKLFVLPEEHCAGAPGGCYVSSQSLNNPP